MYVGQGTIPINYVYPALGLAGEAGEVAEKIKKIIRNKNGIMGKGDKDKIEKEIGDVMWYVAELCTALDLHMGTVAAKNIEKLKDRQKRNVIKSEGDNR